MALPRSVERQKQAAENAMKGMKGDEPPAGAEPPKTEPPANADQGQPNTDWEKRFKNMKRSHDETVSELRGKNSELEGKIEELTGLLEKAETSEPAAQAPTFTPEEVEEYGQDFLDMVTRVAQSASAGASASTVSKELKELKGQFDNIVQTQAKSESDKFFEQLDQAVPNWEQINEDERFLAWLAQEMPMTGMERQHFLKQAQQRYDAAAVIGFFTSWQEQSGESVMPSTVSTSNEFEGERGQTTEVFTESGIAAFYKDKKLGKFRGREDEARQIEMRIFRAQNEGRVVKG